MMRLRSTLLALLGVMATWSAAAAPPPPGDPHGGSPSWERPPPAEQVAADGQLMPAGSGAIFVPAMTEPAQEPEVLVYRDGNLVRTARTGRKIFVVPGTYDVYVGSGSRERMIVFEARVVEGRVTVVPVEWSGLVVDTVDEHGTSVRVTYDLVHLPDRAYVGQGIGAAISEGERLETWLLPPGLYMLLRTGESYRARSNFYTVRLLPGHLHRLTLVVDPNTGDFLGAGEIERTVAVRAGWRVRWLVGGNVELTHSASVVGKEDGTEVAGGVFSDAQVRWERGPHLLWMRAVVDLAATLRFPVAPFRPDTDQVDLETLYVYRFAPWVGPYVRAAVRTGLLPSIRYFDQPTDVAFLSTGGSLQHTDKGLRHVQLAPPLDRAELSFGGGLRFETRPAWWFDASLLVGPGGRHLATRDLYVEDDDPDTPAFEIRQVPPSTRLGLESRLLTQLIAGRWGSLRVEADFFGPFDQFADLSLRLRTVATIRLSTFASLNYTLLFERDPQVTRAWQQDHSLLLRFAWQLF